MAHRFPVISKSPYSDRFATRDTGEEQTSRFECGASARQDLLRP
jgi:hypothetical protein